MSLMRTLSVWSRPLFFLGQNPTSMMGVAITTSSAITLVAFWFYFGILSGQPHPYLGILIFLILPALFILGLLLIPIGIYFRRRSLRARGEEVKEYPEVSLAIPAVRRGLMFIVGATCVNFFLIGTASYKGVSYLDSTSFCGETCHSVMGPEFTAYQKSAHSHVECAACHVGPGAHGFVRAKLAGTRQLVSLAFHTYSRPIPSPVENLRPASETCDHCHSPQRFIGDKLLIRKNFQDDEKNTPHYNVVLMHVGGAAAGVGVHGHHVKAGASVRYISIDRERQTIPVVDYEDGNGKKTSYVSTDVKTTPEQLAKSEHREMDCTDCHNRPGHAFELPDAAVNKQMASGQISPDLPFIKKKAVELLKADYPDGDAAQKAIVAGLDNFYKTSYPQVYSGKSAVVKQSAEAVAAIYARNVFPSMKLTWGTHPSNLGHNDSAGCFRCHDGSHTSADGQTIPNDCGTCHVLVAMDDEKPQILSDLAPPQ
jgi:NapC/NirT cytochrome c family, N-terminal region/Cytochrome c7 and related cytochrome c